MALLEINRDPDERTLRQFGFTACGLSAGFCLWMLSTGATVHLAGFREVVGVALIAAIAGNIAAFRPQALKWPFIALSYLTAPFGMIVGELVTLLMFFCILLPLGLVFRMLGRNPLDWRFRRDAASYWQPKVCGREAASYFRQF